MARRRGHYGRKSPRAIEGEVETAVFPLAMAEYREHRLDFTFQKRRADLLADPSFAPYKIGEIVYASAPGAEHASVARIMAPTVITEWAGKGKDKYADCRAVRYKVQFLTKQGTWSKLWSYVVSEDIFRGYFDTLSKPRENRPPFLLKQFLDKL